ncbi:ABC transporter permease [Luteibacter sp. NPDC031894]|uniref:ABC transporter permease n=1 Tax=Luteibacter sp. NPDC031894 TaxID=3390572 RepID=UPI003D032CD8
MNRRADMLRAGRALLRRPGFLMVASATLALGVAAMIGTFTLVDSLLLQPPPWPNHARVVVYGGSTAGDRMRAISPRLYVAIGLPSSVSSRGLARLPETINAVAGGHRELLRAQRVDPGFLPTLGVVPLHGKQAPLSDDDVFVSHALWRRWFACDPDAVGRAMLVDGRRMTVRGVLPEDYRFFSDVDLLLPLGLATSAIDSWENMTAVALLAVRHDVNDFSDDVVRSATAHAGELRLGRDDLRWYGATPIDELLAPGAHASLWMFAACAVLVVVVAGVNVSQLMSTRMFGRIHETALQMVFGANRWQAWIPALTDAMAIGLAASLAGAPIGFLLVGLFRRFVPSPWLSSALPPSPGWRVLLAVAAMTFAVVLLAAMHGAMRARMNLLMRERSAMGGLTGLTTASGNARSTMAMVQVALATLLVSLGVAAVVREGRLERTPAGFDATNAMAVEIHPPRQEFPEARDIVRLVDAIRTALARVPGVETVSWSTELPTGRGFVMPFLHRDGTTEFLQYGLTTPGAAQAMGMRKIAGRWFDEADGPYAGRVALVNEAYLRRFAGSAMGGLVLPASAPDQAARIVGVVADTRRDSMGPDNPAVFIPLAQASPGTYALVRDLAPSHIVLRGPAASSVARKALPRIVEDLAPSLALSSPTSMEQIADAPLADARRDVMLFSTLSLFAIGLAGVGQYSVQTVEVAAARDAIALRAALGATPRNLLTRVLRKALGIALAGIALGLTSMHVLQHWLYPDVALPGGFGIATTAVAALIMVLATVAAALAPARRAADVEAWRVVRSD